MSAQSTTAPRSVPLLTQQHEGVLWLRLNRPEVLNALDRRLGQELIAALERARYDDEVRAIVLTGEGRAFCSGDDIGGVKAFLEGDWDHASAAIDVHDRSALYLRAAIAMVQCPKPIVAAINGACFGAGTELACAADIRCIARTARIGSSLVRIGEVGHAAFLGAVVGASRAFEIYVSGRVVSPDEALSIGLAHHVFDDAQFGEAVAALARQLAELPTRVIGLQKKLRNDCEGRSLIERALIQEQAHRRCMSEMADAREGALAFLEKRPPRFTGL